MSNNPYIFTNPKLGREGEGKRSYLCIVELQLLVPSLCIYSTNEPSILQISLEVSINTPYFYNRSSIAEIMYGLHDLEVLSAPCHLLFINSFCVRVYLEARDIEVKFRVFKGQVNESKLWVLIIAIVIVSVPYAILPLHPVILRLIVVVVDHLFFVAVIIGWAVIFSTVISIYSEILVSVVSSLHNMNCIVYCSVHLWRSFKNVW